MKTVLKGQLVSVDKIDVIARKDGSGNFKTINLFISEPGFTDSYGKRIRETQVHCIKAFNKVLDGLPPELIEGALKSGMNIDPPEPVEIELYINTRMVEKKEDGKAKKSVQYMYITELIAKSVVFQNLVEAGS